MTSSTPDRFESANPLPCELEGFISHLNCLIANYKIWLPSPLHIPAFQIVHYVGFLYPRYGEYCNGQWEIPRFVNKSPKTAKTAAHQYQKLRLYLKEIQPEDVRCSEVTNIVGKLLCFDPVMGKGDLFLDGSSTIRALQHVEINAWTTWLTEDTHSTWWGPKGLMSKEAIAPCVRRSLSTVPELLVFKGGMWKSTRRGR